MSIVSMFRRNEKGQTALETAIILIAFLVIASVVASIVLNAGENTTSICDKYKSAPLPEPLSGKCGYATLQPDQPLTLKDSLGGRYKITLTLTTFENLPEYKLAIVIPGETDPYVYGLPAVQITDSIPLAVKDIAIQRHTDESGIVTTYVRFFPTFSVVEP